jgi:putative transposase
LRVWVERAPAEHTRGKTGRTERQIPKSRKHVARRMRLEGLRARVRKGHCCTTVSDHDQPVAANLLDWRFEAERPEQRWVDDITGGPHRRGRALPGGDPRSVLADGGGLSIAAKDPHHLAIRALEQASRRRCPEAGLWHHATKAARARARIISGCSPPTESRAA